MDNNSIFRLRGEKMGFTHFDEKGNAVMVDVSEKEVTSRVAVASGKIRVNSRDYGSKEDIGSDSDVSHSSDHKVQGRVRDG